MSNHQETDSTGAKNSTSSTSTPTTFHLSPSITPTAAPPGRLQASDFPIQNLDLSIPKARSPSFGPIDRERPKLNRQLSTSSNHSSISIGSSGHNADLENEIDSNHLSDSVLEEVEEEIDQEEEERDMASESGSSNRERRGRSKKRGREETDGTDLGEVEEGVEEEEEDNDIEDKRSLLSETRHLLEDAASIFDPNAYLKSQAAYESDPNLEIGDHLNSSSFSRFISGSRSRSRQRVVVRGRDGDGDEESSIGGMNSTDDDEEIQDPDGNSLFSSSVKSSIKNNQNKRKKRSLSKGNYSISSGFRNNNNFNNYGSTLSFTPLNHSNNSQLNHLRNTNPQQSMQEFHQRNPHSSNLSSYQLSSTNSNINLPLLESSITLREALISHSTNPGSNLGLILIAISQLGYSFMNLFVKLLDEREGTGSKPEDRSSKDGKPLGALEIVATECFIMWMGCVIAMKVAKTEHILLGPPGTRVLLFIRGLAGFLSTYFLYLSLQALTLSDATTITFLGPLTTGILAFFLLGEKFTLREALAGIGSLVGVVLIARPEALFGSNGGGDGIGGGGDVDFPIPPSEGEESSNMFSIFLKSFIQEEERTISRGLAIFISLLGVLSMSFAWVSLRCIGKKASTYHSIQYFSLVSWTFSGFLMFFRKEEFVFPRRLSSLFFLIMIGVMSLIAQVFQTLGLQREKAGRAAVVSYGQILFATLWQLLLFNTPLEFLSVLGSLLILINGLWISLSSGDDARGGAH